MRVEPWRGDSCAIKRDFRVFPCLFRAREDTERGEPCWTGAESSLFPAPSYFSPHPKDFIDINPLTFLSHPLISLVYG